MHHDRSGWQPDPTGRYEYRWHNGHGWTGDVAVGGRHFVDPLGASALTVRRAGRRPAIVGLVIGLCSLAVAWLPLLFAASIVGGVVASLLAGVALRRAGSDQSTRSLARGAFAASAVALALSVVGAFLTVRFSDDFIGLASPIDPDDYRATVTECASDGNLIIVRGAIENLGTEERDFELTVSAVDATGAEVDRSRTTVRDVTPGERGDFVASGTAGHVAPLTCSVDEVTTPSPFMP